MAKLRRRLTALMLCAVLVFSTVFTMAPEKARANTIDDVANQLRGVYDKLILDSSGNSAVATAKMNLNGLSRNPNNAPWPDVFSFLLTSQVKTRLGGEAAAKDKIIDFICDIAAIQYSTDSTQLKNNLDQFRNQHSSTITTLFGNDFTIDDLYNYLLVAKGKLPNVITTDVSSLITIASGDYTQIRGYEKTWLSNALTEAATGSYGKFLNKLSAVGWNIDKVLQAKDKVSAQVDPNYAGEIALMKAFIRSETHFRSGDQNWDNEITIFKGNSLPLKLAILGFTIAGDVLHWSIDNNSVATVNDTTKTLTAVGAGDATLKAFKTNATSDWAYQITLHVKDLSSQNPTTTTVTTDLSDVPDNNAVSLTFGGGVSIEIPANSNLPDNITIGESSAPPPVPNAIVFDISANSGGYTFNQPVAVKLPIPAGITNPVIYFYNPATGLWQYVGGTVSGGVITFSTTHFSRYAINQGQAAVPAANPPAGSYTGSQAVTLMSSGASKILYYTANTAPASFDYNQAYQTISGNNGTITISSSTTLVAAAVDQNNFTTAPLIASYTINSPGGGGGGGGVVVTPTTENNTVSATSGGTVSSSDGSMSVTIPANALSRDGTVNISEVTGANIPTTGVNLRIGSRIFNITLTGANLTNMVTLAFQYDPAKFEGVSADQIGLYYYNESRGAWLYIGGDVDTSAGKVTAELNHFTKFAVMANPSPPVLSDVNNHWARYNIKRLVGLQAISGYPDGTFRPENSITRAEFATILVKAMGWPANAGKVKFADADTIPEWARGYVGAAVANGVINGYEDNTFQADRLVTRAEIAVMVVKALGKGASGRALSFEDAASVPSWAAGYVSTALDEGIVKGMPGNVFNSDDHATRAESAAMINRLLNNLRI